MRRLLQWYANRRRPDETEETLLAWRLLRAFGLVLDLMVLTDTDDVTDVRPLDRTELWFVLYGEAVAKKYRRFGVSLRPGTAHIWRKGRPLQVLLFEARDIEDGMLDLPGWMHFPDVRRGNRQHVWALVVHKEKKA